MATEISCLTVNLKPNRSWLYRYVCFKILSYFFVESRLLANGHVLL